MDALDDRNSPDGSRLTSAAQTAKAKKRAARAAQSKLYAVRLTVLRERYAALFGRCLDGDRVEAARALFVASGIWERDARQVPSRAKKAIESMALAVFMLENKAPS